MAIQQNFVAIVAPLVESKQLFPNYCFWRRNKELVSWII